MQNITHHDSPRYPFVPPQLTPAGRFVRRKVSVPVRVANVLAEINGLGGEARYER